MTKLQKVLIVLGITLSSLYLLSLLGITITWSFFFNPVFGFICSALVSIYFFFKNMEYKDEFKHMVDYVNDKDQDLKYYEAKLETAMELGAKFKRDNDQLLKFINEIDSDIRKPANSVDVLEIVKLKFNKFDKTQLVKI
jgi:hypothetical protein